MTGGRGDVAAAVLQNKVIATIVNVAARAIRYFYQSGGCLKRQFLRWRFGNQKGHNAPREVLGNNR